MLLKQAMGKLLTNSAFLFTFDGSHDIQIYSVASIIPEPVSLWDSDEPCGTQSIYGKGEE